MVQRKNIDPKNILKILDKLDFFNEFTKSEKLKLTQFYKHILCFEENSTIIEEYSLSNSFYIILNGKVAVMKEGISKPIIELGSGDIFGEISFLSKSARTASVIALEKTLTLEFHQNLLVEMGIEMREKIKDKLINILVERLNSLDQKLHHC